MKRGDFVVLTLPGDYGKPRPGLVVQADLFNETHSSVSVVPVTTTIVNAPLFRLTIEPNSSNGLRAISQLMIDKMTAAPRSRIARTIGHADEDLLLRVGRAIALWLGLAG